MGNVDIRSPEAVWVSSGGLELQCGMCRYWGVMLNLVELE